MEKRYSISLYLDTRRKKRNGLFPVKLRVYSSQLEKTKFFQTAFELTESDFRSAWTSLKPKTAFKDLRLRLQSLENKANETASQISPFDLDKFEKSLFRESATTGDAVYYYKQAIESLKLNHQFGTASSYELSLKSFQDFIEYTTGKRPDRLPLALITTDWLMRYENEMIRNKGRSQTTVAIYLRTLRAIFNTAIDAGEIAREHYPFGRKKYIIPAVKNIKKALDMDQLRILKAAVPSNPEQEKAKDFFLLSYACNGMNMKDIALLKWEAIHGDTLVFYRAKTAKTTKSNQKPIEVTLTPLTKEIIKKYGKPSSFPNDFVFDILSSDMTPIEQRRRYQNFTRFINQHLKNLATSVGITDKISTYFARHSFATNAREAGVPLHIIQHFLGHEIQKTTEDYLKTTTNKNQREWMNQITDL